MLRRSPGFTAIAVLTLGLGIGATTAIFTIVNGVILRPLPYREPGRLASLWVDFGVGAQSLPAMSPGDFRDYQQRSQLFEELAAGSGGIIVGATGALTAAGETERVDVSAVTANFFSMLGVDPVYGRHFTADDERFPEKPLAAPQVVILSHGLWARRFGGDPAIVGKRIQLDGIDQTVVGVMPERFHVWLPSEAFVFTDSQIWKPLRFNYELGAVRNLTSFTVLARLKPGVSFDEAQAEMTALAAQLRTEHPELESANMRVRVVPLQHDIVKHAARPLWSLFGAVACLLVIACANVAHLLLARATVREREIALRSALGASRARVVRQLVTESIVLALGGGVLGLFLAYIGVGVLVRVDPSNLPRLETLRMDGGALVFAAAISVLTAVLFGLVPALRAAGVDLNRTLRGAGSACSDQVRLRSALMIGEMALALVLLIGAGLMIRTFDALTEVKPGFDGSKVLTFRLALPFVKYREPTVRAATLRQLTEKLRAIPGVSSVALTSQLPLTGSGALSPYAYNEATARNWESETSDQRFVSQAFFDVMGTHVIAGRAFEMSESGRPDVVIVDATLAARAWPGENPIGKRLQVRSDAEELPYATVVGVVEHVRAHDLARAIRPQIYFPIGGAIRPHVVLRTSVDPASVSAQVRQVVADLDPMLPVDRLRPMTDYVSDSLAQARMNLVVMSMLGGAALLLASVGVYGVFSYSVGQRKKEIGIRIALGQEPAQVRNLVLAEGLRLTVISTAIGLAAAYLLARSLSTLLYQVHPADAMTFGTMAAVLMIVALVGCIIPARRATTVNPLLAIKAE
jgi:putative ABC transport system permease protein